MIYEIAKLKAQLFDKESEQKDTTCGTSVNTKFAKKSILGYQLLLLDPNGMLSLLYIYLRLFLRIDPRKTSRKDNFVPNKPSKASIKTNSITVSQPYVIIKKAVNSDYKNFSSKGVDITTKTKRPQPRSNIKNDRVIQICLWCIDSGCSKHMTRNLKLLINFVRKLLGTVRFGNDHVATIMGFGDLKWGNILITRVYFIKSLGHNLFSVGQFCDSDLEVAFRRNTCFVRNLDGVNLLKGNRTTNLYTIDLVTGLSKFKYHKEHLCPFCENRMLVEAARTMLLFSHAPLFLWAEAIATACYTQNHSIIHRRFNKTPYELINGRKPDIFFLHIFGAFCYPKNEHEDIGMLGAIGLNLPYAPSTTTTQTQTKGELDLLFEAMYDDHVGGQLLAAPTTVLAAQAPRVLHAPMASRTTADFSLTPFSQAKSSPSTSQNFDELKTQQQHDYPSLVIIVDNVLNAMFDANTFVNPFATPSISAAESSSSQYVDPSNMHTFYQPYPYEYQ
uniref:Integrase, catalytic region, zinc finger, CCHC-type, peptidase aspartic, catalytic n=1 Tax=Tanacetum cinerariifolium TaxID=118510 RepID=A0A6L2MYH1_TANCI|nr:integrase, catalytic region, zinc finger, CCHC-type, peptidase aspartic, catalytic [Tanacetum cinerariifolium]